MHFWEQRQALAAAPGNNSRSWRIQGAACAGAQPESTSPSSASASISIGEKSETLRRKRKWEAEETSAKPYSCRFCSQSFDKSQALGGHMNRHRQEREREQLDNAQKLVLKQQSLQGLSGLPMQTLNQRAKLQGPTSLLSFDQVTLSRYNQAIQYQATPRTFMPGTYSTLHSAGGLLNFNTGTWNLGGYSTGSIASANSLDPIETSGDSSLARAIEGATPEDLFAAASVPEELFAASVLQSAATPPPTLLLPGRTSDTHETDAEQEQDMIYGYPGVANLTQSEASTPGTDKICKSLSCPEFNFNSHVSQLQHSFQAFPQGNVHLGLYPGAVQLPHAVSEVASPRDPLGQSSSDPSDPTCTDDPEEQMKSWLH